MSTPGREDLQCFDSPTPKLLYLVTDDWFFCSHFIDRAKSAREAGFDVLVLSKVNRNGGQIESAGLRLISLAIDRRSMNPILAISTLFNIFQIYKQERPNIVHQVALKPILLGSIAAHLAGVRCVVNAVVGGGYTFTSTKLSMRILRPLLELALRATFTSPRSRVIFENSDDFRTFLEKKLTRKENAVLIRGAGVDPQKYCSNKFSSTPPLVVLAARLLWDKGIKEFVEAARILRIRGIAARFAIVGESDKGNRACISAETIEGWRRGGAVEIWGRREDIPEILAQASIACLPSYREGLPKFLLEAMAAGLPCVTTDVPGCREAVRNGDNGLLVPAQDSHSLANALESLLLSPDLRDRMGRRARERVKEEFSSSLISKQTLALYHDMLAMRDL